MPTHASGLPPKGQDGVRSAPDMSMVGRRMSNGEIPEVNHLKQELLHSQAETRRVADQLNCLVSLIKRAWTGDKSATHHLSNIVGLPPPDFLDGTKGRPASRADSKTRAVLLWERLTIRLLERNYAQLQNEIAMRQNAYLASRHQYMDAILQAHQHDMASNVTRKMEEVDKRFVKSYGLQGRRPSAGRKLYRTTSKEGRRARPPTAKDMVENADITLRDLVAIGDPAPSDFVNSGGFPRRHSDLGHSLKKKPYAGPDYDDPSRYAPQANLFDVDQVFSPDAFSKRPRPISASAMQERDALRARPRSAVFITQRGERPMKYETTRPVDVRKVSLGEKSGKGGKSRAKESSSPPIYPPPDPQGWEDERNDPISEEEEYEEATEPPPDLIKAPLRMRVDSALNRPKHVNQLTEDLKRMGDMEEVFRQTTMSLQKKLGLDENGFV